MQMEYEILSHTADLRIRAFRNALRGLGAVIRPDALERKPETRRPFGVTAPDATALLIDFLSEALALAHIHREVYVDVHFDELSDRSARGHLCGVPVPDFAEDVKAVTYHGAAIVATERGHQVTIVCDI